MTNIGIFNHGWWPGACEALGQPAAVLPITQHVSGNAYAAEANGRLANGSLVREILAKEKPDLLVDNGGTGLGFVSGAGGPNDLRLVHEDAGVALASHFIDPLVTAFQGLSWDVVWQCLQSPSWVKFLWDRAQVLELRRMGIPSVMHLRMAAPNRVYDTSPIEPSSQQPIVSFVGGQNTSYFSSGAAVASTQLLPGVVAHAARARNSATRFDEIYYDWYGLGDPIAGGDPLPTQIEKSSRYFQAKLFFQAALCIQNRDRFVLFLHRRLGDRFRLAGARWKQAYGLTAHPPFPTSDEYFRHFRQAAINLNLVNGNAETGLNMRHFEITAAGGFLLCHEQPELADCFVVGKECAVFHDEKDLLAKIDYFLAHPDERREIALAGQRRCLSQHLYSHRLRSILSSVLPRALPVEYSSSNFAQDARRLLPDARCILDCGANVGQTARSLRKLYPDAQIYSFEPVRTCFDQLQQVCRDIGANPVPRAVGDRDGRASIKLTTSPECHSLLDYQPDNPCAQWNWVVGEEEVEVCTLNRWCADNQVDPRCVDLIKLDVQGAELQALRGATELLKTTKLVFLEVSFVPIYKDCPLYEDIDHFMTAHGYQRAALYPSDQPHNWADALYAKV